MKGRWVSLAVAGVLALLPSSRAAAEDEGVDLSVRYSRLFYVEDGIASIGGWQASVTQPLGGRIGLVLDGGGYYADGESVHALMGGLRVESRNREGPRVFGQLVGGIAFGGGGAVFVAHPGVGLDIGAVRLQVDWPVVTTHGVFFELPRVSAGLRFRIGGKLGCARLRRP